jgi:hypothetical protein
MKKRKPTRTWLTAVLGALALFAAASAMEVQAATLAVPGDYPTIQAAINAAGPNDTIVVAAGTYNERLTINKALTLQGAQYGVDPTIAGARTNPLQESIITQAGLPTTNPDVLIEIPATVSDVILDGFTLIGEPNVNLNPAADRSIIRCWKDRITIADNIMDGARGVLLKGTQTDVGISRNRITVNKNGVIAQGGAMTNLAVSGNVVLPGSSMAADPSGIYITANSNCSITGNQINNFVGPDTNGRGIAGSNNTNVLISGNTITGSGSDAISLWGNTTFVTITQNVLDNNGTAKPGSGIEIKGQDITITDNDIVGNSDTGVSVDRHVIDTERVVIRYNNIFDNVNYGVWVNTALVTEPVDALFNWWGDPTGPYHPTSWMYGSETITNPDGLGDEVTDLVLYDPWFAAPISTARWYKDDAVLELENAKTGNPRIDRRIDKAIAEIEESLDDTLWVDDNRLSLEKGGEVFNLEKKAVKELMKLLLDRNAPESLKQVCSLVIGKLVTADQIIVETAFQDVKAHQGESPEIDEAIRKAELEILKAEEQLALGRPDKAIEHYKKAWDILRKVM